MGIRQGPPKALEVPNPRSSRTTTTTFGASAGVASSLGPMRVPGETVTWVYLPLFGVLVVGAVVVIVQHVRRLPSWFALRQAFRDAGEPLPIGLRNGD